ncbi:hypothetical protein K3U94_07040 [Mycolicibacter heraklionensis]|uniref:Uncharacterized protein n=1 Tax=Mycolicibacter heraklionensis TaxID=512402 RepID=A0A9X7WIQ8_9MYCO|nr:hypothetical protein [Mycolicibacter heraklionensis]QZA09011.1 hypothetical protein K3U94_07040 [Mycolicibacter heraklionensis]
MSKAKKAPRQGLSSDAPHRVEFFQRRPNEDPEQSAPGLEFLRACPSKVQATMLAVLKAVAEAPPKRFAGGGHWEAMHGSMSGWHEVRVDGSKPRRHYRLFCRVDTEALGTDRPILAVITGMSKAVRTTFSEADHLKVRELGTEYFSRNPRSVKNG